MIRLGILGSTRGTNMLAIQQAIEDGRLSAEIAVVISNKPNAIILSRAQALQLPNLYVDSTDKSRADYDAQLSTLLKQYAVDYVVLIGYMRILSKNFVGSWEKRIINVHPSLLPAHAGLMDLEVHQAVLTAKETESGCSVHFVTEEVDAGPVIVQRRCAVLPHDSKESLKARVQTLEGEALIEALNIFSP